MRPPKTLTFQGQVYVLADQPTIPGAGTGKLTVGPHKPTQPVKPQNPSHAVPPQGGGQSAGGPGGPALPIGAPQVPTEPKRDDVVVKMLRKLIEGLRKAQELGTDPEQDGNMRILLSRYKMPALRILLVEWRKSKDRLSRYLDDAEMELAEQAKLPSHSVDVWPGRRLPQEQWPGPGGFKGGPTPA